MEFVVSSLVQNSIKKGLKYIGPLAVNITLFCLTCWIPYFNVGTFIGLFLGLPSKMARDEEITFAEIFDSKYRKNMGDIFLTLGFIAIGCNVGFIFFIIPGFVVCIAWSLACLLVTDKEYIPIDAIRMSNELTYNKKWTIFLAAFTLAVISFISIGILTVVFYKISPLFGYIIVSLGFALTLSVTFGFYSEVYGYLAKDA